MIPNVNLNILDGALGILPDSVGEIVAIMGCSTIGPVNTPAAFARGKDIQTNFGYGDAVEAACYVIEKTGKPVVFVKLNADTVDGYVGFLDTTNVDGSSIITLDGTSTAHDEYEPYFIVTTGGTIGTAGIKFQWSLDGGRTLSPITGLGTADTWTFPNSGSPGVILDFAAGTLLAGDFITLLTDAPKWSTSDVQDGMESLRKTQLKWNFVYLVGSSDASEAAVLGAELDDLEKNYSKYKWGMVNVRRPAIDETEAEYLTTISTDFADFADKRISVGFGYAKTLSSVSRREYRRPVAFGAIGRAVDVEIATDLAAVADGPLPGIRIKDDNLNPDDHDEQEFPGADDARFLALRSVDGFQGTYVNNPKMMSPSGSDFEFIQHRRVMDVVCATVKFALTLRLSKAVRVDKKTGFILNEDKLEIESGVNSALRTALLAPGYVSDAKFVLSPNDNILSTKTLSGEARVIPLAYLKTINVDIGFVNPIIQPI